MRNGKLGEIAYLGPEGTFAHLVARKRFGEQLGFVPLGGVGEVFDYVLRHPPSCGIVPIENSSGGTIYETVDNLIQHCPKVQIAEELSVRVKLALLGHNRKGIKRLYTHFAPFRHCESWLRKHLPGVEIKDVPSTAIAAKNASVDTESAALSGRESASLYGLKILKYPVNQKVLNITQFFCIARAGRITPAANRTTILLRLSNKPGSLCTFLEPFRDEKVNLTRILSRPNKGEPRTCMFLVDIDGTDRRPDVKRALDAARRRASLFHVAGVYPVRPPYAS